MKEIMLGVAVCACCGTSLGTMVTSQFDVASRSENLLRQKTSPVRDSIDNANNTAISHIIDERKITMPSPNLNTGTVKVRVCEFSGGNQENAYYKSFPLNRKQIGYNHDFNKGCSYLVEELSTYITGIEKADIQGKMIINNNFVNLQNPLQHNQRRTGRYQMDDEHLRAYPYTEVYINTNGNNQLIIDAAKVRPNATPIYYTRTSRAEMNLSGIAPKDAKYQSVRISEEYMRPDNTKFVYTKFQQSLIQFDNVGYENNFNSGISYPKQRRYVNIDGQRINIDFIINYSQNYRHMKRTTGYSHDDYNLRSSPYTEIYISAPNGNQVIDSSRYRGDGYISYTRIRTGEFYRTGRHWSDDNYDYYATKQELTYRRPDGSTFVKAIEDTEKVTKPKPVLPVKKIVETKQIPVYQRKWDGGWLNRHSVWRHVGYETRPVDYRFNAVYVGHDGTRTETSGGAPY